MPKLTLRNLRAMKADGKPVTAATAFDFASIRLVEEAEIDIIIPCDWSLSTTLLGNRTALQITLEHVLLYVRGLARLAERGFVLAPMPFGTYQVSNEDAARNATQLMKAEADAVKLEGGGPTIERVRALAEMGIPCCGHLGYTPQCESWLGGERVVGDTSHKAASIYRDAKALQEAGAWGLILQNVPEEVARTITERTSLITLGAGGTRGCNGQFVLTHDLVGWPMHMEPLFSVRRADFAGRAVAALNRHYDEVQASEFPGAEHTFKIPDDEFAAFLKEIGEE